MEEKKKRFEVWTKHFSDGLETARANIGRVNTLAEAQELLLAGFCGKGFKDEIYSHTEDELENKYELTLCEPNPYVHIVIARVNGYDGSNEVTLGDILKNVLEGIGNLKWELRISDSSYFTLKIDNHDPIDIYNYSNIIGMPRYYVDRLRVYQKLKETRISEKTFKGINLDNASIGEVNGILDRYFHDSDMYYTENGAYYSLPNELVLDREYETIQSIEPYDKYGYHIENISAYCGDRRKGVFIHIKRDK